MDRQNDSLFFSTQIDSSFFFFKQPPPTMVPEQTPNSPQILLLLANAVFPPFLLALLIGTPFALLYAFQLWLIVSHGHNEFRFSFFKLYAVRAIASLINVVSHYLYQRFGRLGMFLPIYLALPRLCLATFYFFVFYTFFVENVTITILLLNRLTAIAVPLKYERLWKRLTPWAILATILLPLPFVWHVLGEDEYVRIQSDGSFSLDDHKTEDSPNDPRLMAICVVVSMLVCLCLNLACLVVYRRNSSIVGQTAQTSESRRMENRLTVCTLLTFSGQLLYSAYSIILYFAATQTDKLGFSPEMGQFLFLAVYNQLPWVNDLCHIVLPASMLLWASDPMRNYFRTNLLDRLKSHNAANSVNGPRNAWTTQEMRQNGNAI